MKKSNNKGFMLLETMVVSAFIITTLTFLYVQFSNLKKNYDESFKYDTIPELFKTKEIDKFINNNYGYADILSDVKESNYKYIEVYDGTMCNLTYFSKYNIDCNRLMKDMNVKTVLLVSTDLSSAINKFKTNNPYTNGLYRYIKKINQQTNNYLYSLIVEFKDKKYTNLVVQEEKFGGTKVASQNGETHKGIVYMNPKNIGELCNKQLSDSNVDSTTNLPTGIHDGCMKFYIFDNSGTKYKMILDHNTSGNVAWNSSGSNESGMVETKKRLQEDTSSWLGHPRLITADEVAKITGADSNNTIKWAQNKTYGKDNISTKSSWFYLDGGRNSNPTVYSSESNGWQKQVVNSITKSNYSWLYDYTYQCDQFGCNNKDDNLYLLNDSLTTTNIYGYWTSDVVVGISVSAWCINRLGMLYDYNVSNSAFGIRPVIEVDKSIIDS